jgi:hypothetical protein
MGMDGKLVLGFIADVLYMKGILNADEMDDILDARTAPDLSKIFDKMMDGEYHGNRRGEVYTGYELDRTVF